MSHLNGAKGFLAVTRPWEALRERWWFGYAVAGASFLAAVLFRFGLDPILGERGPFATFFPAVAIAVFFGRLPGGLLAILLTTLAADYLFFSPRHSLGIQSTCS